MKKKSLVKAPISSLDEALNYLIAFGEYSIFMNYHALDPTLIYPHDKDYQ